MGCGASGYIYNQDEPPESSSSSTLPSPLLHSFLHDQSHYSQLQHPITHIQKKKKRLIKKIEEKN